MKKVSIVDQETQHREAIQKAKVKPSLSERAKAATKNLIERVRPAKKWPLNHPHVNPHYRERKGGVMFFWAERPNGSRFVTRQDVGRWMPHNGAREMDRAHAGA